MHTFNQIGAFPYVCSPHASFMKGAIKVLPATRPCGEADCNPIKCERGFESFVPKGECCPECRPLKTTTPEPMACPRDVRECRDGSFVTRDPKLDCEFPECKPVVCPKDARECRDGSFVTRDPKLDCEFSQCPVDPTKPTEEQTKPTESPASDDEIVEQCIRKCLGCGDFCSADEKEVCVSKCKCEKADCNLIKCERGFESFIPKGKCCPECRPVKTTTPEPVFCTEDVLLCPNGDALSRDPEKRCTFPDCKCPQGEEWDRLSKTPSCVPVTCDSKNACSSSEACRPSKRVCIRSPCQQFVCAVAETEPCEEADCNPIKCERGFESFVPKGECCPECRPLKTTTPEPMACPRDVQECRDGSFVTRDQKLDCAFTDCPTSEPETDAPEPGGKCRIGSKPFEQHSMHCGEKVLTMRCECTLDGWMCMVTALVQCTTTPEPTTATKDLCEAVTCRPIDCQKGEETFIPKGECCPRCRPADNDVTNACAKDMRECRDGSFVTRDPKLDCEFSQCPDIEAADDSNDNGTGCAELFKKKDCEAVTVGGAAVCMWEGTLKAGSCSTLSSKTTVTTTEEPITTKKADDSSFDTTDCSAFEKKKDCQAKSSCLWAGSLKDGSCNTATTTTTEVPVTTMDPGCTAVAKKKDCLKVAVAGFSICEWTGTLKEGSCDIVYPKPLDSGEWLFKGKKAKTCAWTKGRKGRCKKNATVAGNTVTGYVACPRTCGDDPKWRFDAAKNGCAWTEGLKERCMVTSTKNKDDDRKAYEACPVTCAKHYK